MPQHRPNRPQQQQGLRVCRQPWRAAQRALGRAKQGQGAAPTRLATTNVTTIRCAYLRSAVIKSVSPSECRDDCIVLRRKGVTQPIGTGDRYFRWIQQQYTDQWSRASRAKAATPGGAPPRKSGLVSGLEAPSGYRPMLPAGRGAAVSRFSARTAGDRRHGQQESQHHAGDSLQNDLLHCGDSS